MSKSYATFDLNRSWQQVRHAWHSRKSAAVSMAALLRNLRRDEARMVAQFGRPVEALRILEIGPGQGLERARYFGLRNEVIGLDLDVIPQELDLAGYYRMFRANGFGRLAKTIGRKLILGPANARAWAQVVNAGPLPAPRILQGDICQAAPQLAAFDVVMSWSVFEHLPEPDQALAHVIQALRPGGLIYISLHLYTAHDGHHDIRAFTGQGHTLPLWGHLRPAAAAAIKPSAFLNRWRLAQWRALFNRLTPGAQEYLEPSELKDWQLQQLAGPLRRELEAYSTEELLTVNAVYVWKKPVAGEPA